MSASPILFPLVEVAAGTGVKTGSFVVNAKSGSVGGCHLGCHKTAHFKVRVCMAGDRHVPELGDVTFHVACQG